MSVGSELLNAPFPLIVRNLGVGIAEAQLELKHQSGDLPLVPYHIIPDPPGPRIGSGPDWFTLRPRFRCC